jgi:pimeloyl-ACP methyl ester carboxylesterase
MKANKKQMNNQIILRQLPEQDQMSYFYFAPNTIKKVMVLVHGISRNAKELIESFSTLAEKKNYLLIAPVFSKEFAKDYQRLGRRKKGPRSDYQLMAMLKDLQSEINLDKPIEKFNLFGFSAGAQFAHRFAFAHPNLVDKVALVAAGWYTLPTHNLPFPYGTRIKRQFTNIKFEPLRYLRIKFKVYIGENDNQRDEALNKNPKIDMIQGKNRFVRAQNWIDLMHLDMDKRGINNPIQLDILQDVDHDFSECIQKTKLNEKVISWFSEDNK